MTLHAREARAARRAALAPIIARIAGLALLAGVLCGACQREPAKAPPPRQVVLIVVDTLRADHLSAYGYPRPTSPRLEAFAREAALFENCVSQGSFTQASMVSLMTSSYLGEEEIHVPLDRATIAEVFQRAGWTTGAFVFNDVLNEECRFNRGFDAYAYKAPPYGPDTEIAEWFRANREHPTFTWIHLNEAHDPYGTFDGKWPKGAPAPFVERADSLQPEQRRWLEDYAAQHGLKDSAEQIEHIAREIGAYDDDVAYSDAHVGRILDAIRDAGSWDSSAIVIAADHGEGLWTREFYLTGTRLKAFEHGETPTLLNQLHPTHGSQVNWELVHVPLLVKAPGLPGGRRIGAFVQNVDIAPTLFELCDLPLANAVNGQSLVPLARGEEDGAKRHPAFCATRFVATLVDQDAWQLVHPTENGTCAFALRDELYDLRKDPQMRDDRAAQEPERVERMKAEIQRRLASGIHRSDEGFGPETVAALNGLGYLASGVVEEVQKFLGTEPTDALIEKLKQQGASCLTRREIVRALAKRELNDAQRDALQAQLAKESMVDVRAELERVLGR